MKARSYYLDGISDKHQKMVTEVQVALKEKAGRKVSIKDILLDGIELMHKKHIIRQKGVKNEKN